MTTRRLFAGIVLTGLFLASAAQAGGGRYPMRLTKIHGDVQVRLDKPGSRWQKAKLGELMGGPWLLRTGKHSYAHLFNIRCVDSRSIVRIEWDSEASITVVKGQMSAVDGRRGKSLPDNPL